MSAAQSLSAARSPLSSWRGEIAQANAAREQVRLDLAIAEERVDELLGTLAGTDVLLSRAREDRDALIAGVEDLSTVLGGVTLPPAALVALQYLRRLAMLDLVLVDPDGTGPNSDGDVLPDEWTLLGVVNHGRWVVYSHNWSDRIGVLSTETARPVSTDEWRFSFQDDDDDVLVDGDTGLTYALVAVIGEAVAR